MDSVTQIVLGAAVGEVLLGKKVGNKAMLWGAIAGTIPDLDVVIKFFTDDLTGNEMHRGFSHSLVFSLLMAPFLGWLISKIYKNKEASAKQWTNLSFWSLFTHPLLDAHTTWGTQLFWPFDLRLAYKNINVVDPLYTFPFLTCLIIVLFLKRTNPNRIKIAYLGLIVSSVYMLFSIGAKFYTDTIFAKSLSQQQISYKRLSTQPTFGNTMLWYATAENDTCYYLGLYSLLDNTKNIHYIQFKKDLVLLNKLKSNAKMQRLMHLSDNWFLIEETKNGYIFKDLRFGKMSFGPDPDFVFNYNVQIDPNGNTMVKQADPNTKNMKKFMGKMWDRIKGGDGL